MTVVVPTANDEPGFAVVVTDALEQRSVAVGAVQVAVAVEVVVLTVVLAGQAVRDGGVRSLAQGFVTATRNVQVEVLPTASLAV